MFYRVIYRLCIHILFLPILFLACLFRKLFVKRRSQPRLAWGIEPIINNKYWSMAVGMDYPSKSIANCLYSIHSEDDFDILVKNGPLRTYLNFIWSIWSFDILHFSYNGWFLGQTPLASMEPHLLKFAGLKTIVCPYGSDAFVIRWIRDISAQTCLLLSYPEQALRQEKIEKQVRRWVSYADICFSSLMCPDGLGRWDFITPNCVVVDTERFKPSLRENIADGSFHTDPVVIAHCPNHRGVKGTDFIVKSIQLLKEEGLNVELLLMERMKNVDVIENLKSKADILLDQLILPGYGMNAIEAMALGIPVLANVGIDEYSTMYRRFSYYSECPIQHTNPENVVDVLRDLVKHPYKRKQLGLASRKFAEKYHSYDFFRFLFKHVYKKVWYEEEVNLMGLFHPITGIYKKEK